MNITQMNKKSVEAVLERLRQVFDVRTDSELARALNINRQTLSSWRSRETIPYAICVNLSETKRISLDWLLTGDYFDAPIKALETSNSTTHLSPGEVRLLEVFNSLDEKAQLEIHCLIEERKRLRDMEQQLRELQAQLQAKKILT